MVIRTTILGLCFSLCLAAADEDADAIHKRKAAHQPRLSYLDNDTMKIGIDRNLGGAITYLSKSGTDNNLVNNWDWGRQIQMSHYSGPSPFRVPGKEPAGAWAKFPWNPVQAGDHFGFASKTVDFQNDGRELFVKCIPMQWSHANVPIECTFETRISLQGSTAHVRCKLVNSRSDRSRYSAFSQEMPALYVNGSYHKLMTYVGDQPFTGGQLTRIEKKAGDGPPGFPWTRFLATERWAAQVNDAGFGLGVYQPACITFLGGFAGKPGNTGTKDSPTGYIAPVRPEHLDHDIVFEYEYTLILGSLEEIRKQANRLHGKPTLPHYRFDTNRQGWTLANGTDRGWKLTGDWDITPGNKGAQLIGPVDFWRAESGPKLQLKAAFTTTAKEARVFWATLDDPKFSAERSTSFAITGDGMFRKYTVNLAEVATYRGGLVQLRLDTGECERCRVQEISIVEP